MNIQLTLIGKPGCHLCDDAKLAVDEVIAAFSTAYPAAEIALTEQNILLDSDLALKYSDEIPVLLIDGKVHTSLGKLTALNHIENGQKGVVAVRSENFYLQPNPNGDSEVIGRVFFGHDAVVEVQTPGQKIRARSNGPFAPAVGMRVTVWVRGSVNFYPN